MNKTNEMKKFNPQLFGKHFPPLYKLEECVEVLNKISKIDEEINEKLIQRELYVKDLKEKIKKTADSEDKN